jgi:predicted RNA-binding Zn-ribbon protein involved in translation (DUF1610 family)
MTTDSATNDLESETQKLQATFEARKAELRCPACGNETMQMMDSLSSTEGTALVHYQLKRGSNILLAEPTVSLACINCGLVRQFVRRFLMREPNE